MFDLQNLHLLLFYSNSWADVFSDPDSGMASYKWGIGSQPGYDDKYSFTETVSTCSQTAEGHFVRLDEGHSYFVTVLVRELGSFLAQLKC